MINYYDSELLLFRLIISVFPPWRAQEDGQGLVVSTHYYWITQPRSWLLKSALCTSLWIRSSSSILYVGKRDEQTNWSKPNFHVKYLNERSQTLTPSLDCPSGGRARHACWRWPPILRAAVFRAASALPSSANLLCVTDTGRSEHKRKRSQYFVARYQWETENIQTTRSLPSFQFE